MVCPVNNISSLLLLGTETIFSKKLPIQRYGNIEVKNEMDGSRKKKVLFLVDRSLRGGGGGPGH